jgi:hypothetical protein
VRLPCGDTAMAGTSRQVALLDELRNRLTKNGDGLQTEEGAHLTPARIAVVRRIGSGPRGLTRSSGLGSVPPVRGHSTRPVPGGYRPL